MTSMAETRGNAQDYGDSETLPPENVAAIELLDSWLSQPPQPEPRTRLRCFWRTGGRWKGEMYVVPSIRVSWGRDFASIPRSCWLGLYWLQWSVHFGLVEYLARERC